MTRGKSAEFTVSFQKYVTSWGINAGKDWSQIPQKAYFMYLRHPHVWKNCLGLAILRFVPFPCHRCLFWSWQERIHASVLSGKKRAMQFAILPLWTFLNTQLCQTGLLYHLFVLHPAQWGLNLGYSPKAPYCRHLAFTSHSALSDAVCSTPKCWILPQTTMGSLL